MTDTPVIRLFATEIVWDTGLTGTGVTDTGVELSVGEEGDCSPAHLLSLAAESCFMSTYLRVAEQTGLTVLGYVSTAWTQVPSDPKAATLVTVCPCIVVATEEDAVNARRVRDEALLRSPVCRALGDRLTVEATVNIITPTVAPAG